MGISIFASPKQTYFVGATQPPIVEGYVWYDTVNQLRKLCDGSSYNAIGGLSYVEASNTNTYSTYANSWVTMVTLNVTIPANCEVFGVVFDFEYDNDAACSSYVRLENSNFDSSQVYDSGSGYLELAGAANFTEYQARKSSFDISGLSGSQNFVLKMNSHASGGSSWPFQLRNPSVKVYYQEATAA